MAHMVVKRTFAIRFRYLLMNAVALLMSVGVKSSTDISIPLPPLSALHT